MVHSPCTGEVKALLTGSGHDNLKAYFTKQQYTGYVYNQLAKSLVVKQYFLE